MIISITQTDDTTLRRDKDAKEIHFIITYQIVVLKYIMKESTDNISDNITMFQKGGINEI